MTAQALWTLAGAGAALAVAAAFADHRRERRRNLDRPGWAPWGLIQILAAIVTVVAAVLAMRA